MLGLFWRFSKDSFCKALIIGPGTGNCSLNGSDSVSYCGLGPLCPYSKEDKKGKKEKEKKAEKEGERNLGLELEEKEERRDQEIVKNMAM